MALTKVKAGNILLTTPSASSNDVTPATTAYVTTALANLADSAPETLNTLNELAAALGDDANFSTTVTNSIALKAPLASPTFTGTITGTLATAAQTNITSVGTLTGFTSTGIDDNATSTAITIDSSENSTFSGNINLDLATPTVIFKESGAAKFFIGESSAVGGGSGFYDLYATAGLGLRFFTAAAERLHIDSSGNVQIGTVAAGTSSESPIELNLGSTFASTAGSAAKTKLKLFEDNQAGDIYGFGVSSGTLEYHISYTLGKHDWYIGTDRKMSITHDGNIDVGTNNTGSLRVPNGTTAQRPTGANGMIRYNTTDAKLEGYIDSQWQAINTGLSSLTEISGLQVWADVTGGITSATVADLSGNNRTGTLVSTSAKGTLAGNTYFEAFGSNYIEYGVGGLPNSPWSGSNACTYFFVCTNKKTNNSYGTYIGQTNGSVNYQIIRHNGASVNYNIYGENVSEWGITATNAVPVNATISEAYILIFQFSAPSGN